MKKRDKRLRKLAVKHDEITRKLLDLKERLKNLPPPILPIASLTLPPLTKAVWIAALVSSTGLAEEEVTVHVENVMAGMNAAIDQSPAVCPAVAPRGTGDAA